MLSLAARRADTVALSGLLQAPGQPPGTFHMQTAAQTDERVRFVRAQAGDRADDLELNVLIQAVVVTPDLVARTMEVAEQARAVATRMAPPPGTSANSKRPRAK